MGNYHRTRILARTMNYEPTKTDQSQRDQTDINIIVRQAGIHGQAPGPAKPPMYADFAALPEDLRGFLEMGQDLQDSRARLPEALSHLSNEDLVNADPRDLQRMINNRETAIARRKELPPHLQALPDASVLALTETQLDQILGRNQPPKEPPK